MTRLKQRAHRVCSKDYGVFAPFKIRAGPHSYIVLRDPVHVQRVLDAQDHLTGEAARFEMLDKLFGSPEASERFYQVEARTQKEYEDRGSRLFGVWYFHIPDTALNSSVDTYVSILSANMHDKMFQYDTWARIEDLWSFLQLVLLRCTLVTFFGSALLKQYPRMVRDYMDFNDAAEGFVYGMPRMMVSGVAKSRDRLHQGMRDWLVATRVEINKRYEYDDDETPDTDEMSWNEKTGLPFVCRHYNGSHDIVKFRDKIIKGSAAEVLSIVHTYVTLAGWTDSILKTY